MQVKIDRPAKISQLEDAAGNIGKCPIRRREFDSGAFFDTVHIWDRSRMGGNDTENVRIGYEYRGGVFAAVFSRMYYSRGEEVGYRADGRYCNKLVMLATHGGEAGRHCAALLALAMTELDDDAPVIAECSGRRTSDILTGLGFVRIGGRGIHGARYVFSFAVQDNRADPRRRNADTQPEVPDGMSPDDRHYYDRLHEATGFSIHDLVAGNWTTYRRNGTDFLFTLTRGRNESYGQDVLKFDMYDPEKGLHVAYVDIFVSPECNYAVNDIPATKPASELPRNLPRHFAEKCVNALAEAGRVRNIWRSTDGIWVRRNYRRAGIGGSLERIAGDVCKMLYPGITALQVRSNPDNPRSFGFHLKNGARRVKGKLYNLEYRLDRETRPDIIILYGV